VSVEPQRWSHEERLALAYEITERTKRPLGSMAQPLQAQMGLFLILRCSAF
jgi:hypothetical protein